MTDEVYGVRAAIMDRGLDGGDLVDKANLRNIRQNLFFAFIYNTAGVPVAAGVLFSFFGILISLMFTAFAMSASSISVVLNALRLRSAKIQGEI